MANIVISLFDTLASKHGGLLCYYEGLINELTAQGNNVLVVNIADFRTEWLDGKVRSSSYIQAEVKKFKPDLAIAVNNQIFPGFYDLECRTCIWDGDGYSYFANKEELKKIDHQITLITGYKSWIHDYSAHGFDLEKIFHIAHATSIKPESLLQNKNISFIGTAFFYREIPITDCRFLYEKYLSFLNAHSYEYKDIVGVPDFSEENLYGIFDIRNLVLTHLLDLGLYLYGVDWNLFEDRIPQISFAFNREPAYTLPHNSNIYNSSKIGISVSHPQTKGKAFPWRIFDIMASNACVVSSPSEDLKELTKGYVNVPMYETPIEAHDLCKKLLEDDVWRKEIVAASNEYIDKYARWPMKFKQMEEIFGISLCNDSEVGSLQILKPLFHDIKLAGWRIYLEMVRKRSKRSKRSKNIAIKIWPKLYLKFEKIKNDE